MGKIIYVSRQDYEIAFTIEDGDPILEVKYHGFGDAQARASDTIRIDDDKLELTVHAKMTTGEYTDAGVVTPIGADKLGEMSAGQTLPGSSTGREPGLHMRHLRVDEEYQRHGAGRFMFDVYRVAAVFLDQHASGTIGSYETSKDFLISQGVPAHDVEKTKGTWSGGDAAYWSTPASNLHEGDPNVVVEA
jgi:hypothetical protein